MSRSSCTFADVCQRLLRPGAKLGLRRDDILLVVGGLIVLTPIALGPPFLPLLALLEAKNELAAVLSRVWAGLTSSVEETPLNHEDRIVSAYCWAMYSSALDSLAAEWPRLSGELRELGLHDVDIVGRDSNTSSTQPSLLDPDGSPLTVEDLLQVLTSQTDVSRSISLPFPGSGYITAAAEAAALHGQLFDHLVARMTAAIKYETDRDIMGNAIQQSVSEMRTSSRRRFSAYYEHLCADFTDFAAWANLNEHHRTQAAVDETLHEVSHRTEDLGLLLGGLDIGLTKLTELLRILPQSLALERQQNISEALRRRYVADAQEPVFQLDTADGQSLPTREQVYVAPSFRALRYLTAETALEDPSVWDATDRREDLSAYLLAMLRSPHSSEVPILILGQPGSGKSLLTQLLAARLAAPAFIVVRVELRRVLATDDIQLQVERALRSLTGLDVQWGDFRSANPTHPVVLIFDGYDELLQASGTSHTDYLERLRLFQKSELALGRPVRILVTSRLTLIDRTVVPLGSIVILLEEFDSTRLEAWMDLWNAISWPPPSPLFALPPSDPIRELARQPLLLAILALYDMESSNIASLLGSNRGTIYYSLVNHFLRRELKKTARFANHPERSHEIEIEVLQQMRYLSLVSVAMFVRGKLAISERQLDADLHYLASTTDADPSSPSPSAAQLLRKFFFIVESSVPAERVEASESTNISYEFLHNSLGEFLLAYYVLDCLRIESLKVSETAAMGSGVAKALLATLVDGPMSFDLRFRQVLSRFPIHNRPLVLELMTHWAESATWRQSLPEDEQVVAGQVIWPHLLAQLRLDWSDLQAGVRSSPWPGGSIMGDLALYTLNLFVLMSIICPTPLSLPIRRAESQSEIASEWSRLRGLWNTWLRPRDLMGLAEILNVGEHDATVTLRSRREGLRHDRVPRSLFESEEALIAAHALDDTRGRSSLLYISADEWIADELDIPIESLVSEWTSELVSLPRFVERLAMNLDWLGPNARRQQAGDLVISLGVYHSRYPQSCAAAFAAIRSSELIIAGSTPSSDERVAVEARSWRFQTLRLWKELALLCVQAGWPGTLGMVAGQLNGIDPSSASDAVLGLVLAMDHRSDVQWPGGEMAGTLEAVVDNYLRPLSLAIGAPQTFVEMLIERVEERQQYDWVDIVDALSDKQLRDLGYEYPPLPLLLLGYGEKLGLSAGALHNDAFQTDLWRILWTNGDPSALNLTHVLAAIRLTSDSGLRTVSSLAGGSPVRQFCERSWGPRGVGAAPIGEVERIRQLARDIGDASSYEWLTSQLRTALSILE